MCHTPPAQSLLQKAAQRPLARPNSRQKATRRTRWRRVWPAWFARTCCTTASGKDAPLCTFISCSFVSSATDQHVFSLQPCMHAFCAACYSGWMERSTLCPTCRCPVERIRKNHILNNLVEAYLTQHPGLTSDPWTPTPHADPWPLLSPLLQRSAAARRTWRAWTAATRSRRTCCSRGWSAPSPTRRAAPTISSSCRTTTATRPTSGSKEKKTTF